MKLSQLSPNARLHSMGQEAECRGCLVESSETEQMPQDIIQKPWLPKWLGKSNVVS